MTVLLYSGGLDCYCLNKLYEPEQLLFVHPGTEEAEQEIELVEETVDEFEVIRMQFLERFEDPDTKAIPFRNTFFALAGALYDEEVMLGATLGDGITPDTTRQWASATEAVMNVFGGPYTEYSVVLPGRMFSKGELVALVLDETDVGYEQILEESRSCHYGSNEKGCGECFGCLTRFVSFGYLPEIDEDVLYEYFESDPLELYEEAPKKISDDFARRRKVFLHFLDTLDRFGYSTEYVPTPTEVVREE